MFERCAELAAFFSNGPRDGSVMAIFLKKPDGVLCCLPANLWYTSASREFQRHASKVAQQCWLLSEQEQDHEEQ